MARPVDLVKRQLWRRRFRRFERSRLTVAAFCREEGVSTASFQQWRRRLGQDAIFFARPAAKPSFVKPSSSRRQAFLPVEIVGMATVEMRLPNGARLSLPAGDFATLEAAVAAVGRLPQASREVESC